jgi:phosphoglycolate phosphatase-like HAD superfamily hydrolase
MTDDYLWVKITCMDNHSRKILLFDIDGTLLEPAGIGRLCYRRALEDVLGHSIYTDHVEMAGRTDWQILNDLLTYAGLAENQIEHHRKAVFDALARHIATAAPTSKIHSLPGVLSLMDRLALDERFLLGLVTGNSRAVVSHKLHAVGIDPGLFIVGAFGDEHPDRNALPALALYRLSQMLGDQISPESVLVIGDTPHDIACARHTGLKVLGVATGLYPYDELAKYEPDFLLEDFSDNEAVIEIFERF